jgi:hypothetical protein
VEEFTVNASKELALTFCSGRKTSICAFLMVYLIIIMVLEKS